jgi:hypothetical protein
VREIDEIVDGLTLTGRRDGLTFMPEMSQFVGRRFRVLESIPKVFEHDRWIEPRSPIYILDGLHCSGSRIGEPGPCDLACSLLWHEDWLLLEPPAASRGRTEGPARQAIGTGTHQPGAVADPDGGHPGR